MSEKTEGEIAITSDAQTIMDVIGDLPAYPEWAEGVTSAEILESFPDGRCKVIRMDFASGPIKDSFWSMTGTGWTPSHGGLLKVRCSPGRMGSTV